jgi:hypothetical protein
MHISVAGLLGALVAVLAAGCGAGEPLSKEQYASKLNGMCTDFSTQEKEVGEPQSFADLREKEPLILEAFDRAIFDKVRALKAPDEIAVQADRLVENARRQRDVMRQLIRAAQENDFAKVRELVPKNDALNEEARSITRDLGADACAQD